MSLGQKLRMACLLLLAAANAAAATTAGVALVRAAAWVPGETAREGAAEMMVLMEVARLRQQQDPAGLVALGDRRGVFSAGAEEALRRAVLLGVPVVKLANGGRVLPAPHGLFLDGGNLTETEAAAVLVRCRKLYGPLLARGGAPADTAEAPGLHERLQLFQNEFTLAASTRLAVR